MIFVLFISHPLLQLSRLQPVTEQALQLSRAVVCAVPWSGLASVKFGSAFSFNRFQAGAAATLTRNQRTADLVFRGPVHQTGKRPQLNRTELQKTGPSVAVRASRDGRTAPNRTDKNRF
jgi:hypothetical protein